ncbi:MAG: hypothetical protein Q8Q08_08565 [Candidatus Omnitrophota bacterium]|nr:hypothetical protein [Candidatus Omnitrophota bacterium]MDZ4242730.1 hypothetical protein [Candidatus Omnitrophota bacterium]
MAKETAEKKLLKIIESTQAQDAPSADAPAAGAPEVQQVAASVKGLGLPAVEVPPVFSRIIAFFKGQSVSPSGAAVPMGLPQVNKILVAVILLSAVVLILSVFSGMRAVNRGVDFSAEIPEALSNVPQLPVLKDIAEYLTAVGRRNIFQPYEAKVAKVEGGEALVEERIIQQTRDLRLVGVSWLDTPESASAMIENISSGVTHFLRTGEKINGVKVEKIYADSIILSFEDEEMELRL